MRKIKKKKGRISWLNNHGRLMKGCLNWIYRFWAWELDKQQLSASHQINSFDWTKAAFRVTRLSWPEPTPPPKKKPNESQPILTIITAWVCQPNSRFRMKWGGDYKQLLVWKNIWRQFNSTWHLICITMIPLLAGWMWFSPSQDSDLLLIISCSSQKGRLGLSHPWARHHGYMSDMISNISA